MRTEHVHHVAGWVGVAESLKLADLREMLADCESRGVPDDAELSSDDKGLRELTITWREKP